MLGRCGTIVSTARKRLFPGAELSLAGVCRGDPLSLPAASPTRAPRLLAGEARTRAAATSGEFPALRLGQGLRQAVRRPGQELRQAARRPGPAHRLEEPRLDGDFEPSAPYARSSRHQRDQSTVLRAGGDAQDQAGPDFSWHAEVDQPHSAAIRSGHPRLPLRRACGTTSRPLPGPSGRGRSAPRSSALRGRRP